MYPDRVPCHFDGHKKKIQGITPWSAQQKWARYLPYQGFLIYQIALSFKALVTLKQNVY